jgi:hypothetical protein
MAYNNSPQSNVYRKKFKNGESAPSVEAKSGSALSSGVKGDINAKSGTSLGAISSPTNNSSASFNNPTTTNGGRGYYNGKYGGNLLSGIKLPGIAGIQSNNKASADANANAGELSQMSDIKPQSESQTLTDIQPSDLSEMVDVGLQPKNQPTIYDFIEEAKKLGQEGMQSQIDILKQSLPDFEQSLARSLYGKNVGAQSGIGSDIVSRATQDYLGKLTPYIQQSGTELGKMALNNQQKEVDNLFSLVESGQLTGQQAENVLRQKGINPEEYMTPEQAELKQQEDQLNTLKDQFRSDPKFAEYQHLVDLIDSVDEYNHVLEFGRTYEDEMADIFSTQKSLTDWKTLVDSGTLQKQVSRLEQQINNEAAKSSNWLPWDKPNDGKIGKWQQQLAAIKEIISSVKAGKQPMQDIESYRNMQEDSGGTDWLSKIALGALAPGGN